MQRHEMKRGSPGVDDRRRLVRHGEAETEGGRERHRGEGEGAGAQQWVLARQTDDEHRQPESKTALLHVGGEPDEDRANRDAP
ncbi:MAG TPA: hypothetical protein VHU80_06135, partial [Polyangiaceae bacterium]|nr:hypothetical protein [Polyangiaceae bacterium]